MKTVFTKDGVEVEKGTNKYKGHIFYDEDGGKYKCLGYFPKLDDCVYENLQTGKEVVGCMDGFYFKDPTKKYAKGSTIKGGEEKKILGFRNKLVKMNVGKNEPSLDFSIKIIDMLIDGELVVGNGETEKGSEYEKKILGFRNKLVKMNVGKNEPSLDFSIKIIDMLIDGELVVKYAKGSTINSEKILTRGEIENKIDGLKLRIAKTKKQISGYETNERGKYNKLWQEKVVPLQKELNELSELWGKSKYAKGGSINGFNYTIGGL